MNYDASAIQQKRRSGKNTCKEKSSAIQFSQGKTKTDRKKIEIKEGQTFGRLTAICFNGKDRYNHPIWMFLCTCGKKKEISAISVFKGVTRSCGCLRKENSKIMKSTHGLGHLDEYVIWCGIKQRCFNPKCKEYRLYGARGIILCDAWKHDFKAFYEYIGPRPTKHHSIDRIDSNGNYEPGNVRWATHLEQANNVRSNTILTCRGESKTMAMKLNIGNGTL